MPLWAHFSAIQILSELIPPPTQRIHHAVPLSELSATGQSNVPRVYTYSIPLETLELHRNKADDTTLLSRTKATLPNKADGLIAAQQQRQLLRRPRPQNNTRTYSMRCSIPVFALCVATVSALQLPDLQPFLSAIPISISDYIPPTAENIPPQEVQHKSQRKAQEESQPHHNLFRRQNDDTCPSSYNNCANIGAPGLCCSPSARCSADAAGHVACCPRGAACTGTIGAINTGSSTRTATGTSSGATSNSGLFVTASTTQTAPTTGDNSNTAGGGGGNGFVLDGTQTVATPGAGMRAVQAPLVARAIIRLIEYIPL